MYLVFLSPVLWSANLITVFPIPKSDPGPPEYDNRVGVGSGINFFKLGIASPIIPRKPPISPNGRLFCFNEFGKWVFDKSTNLFLLLSPLLFSLTTSSYLFKEPPNPSPKPRKFKWPPVKLTPACAIVDNGE